MKRSNLILVAILLIGFSSGFAWFVMQPREPVWQGKPLSVWVRGFEGPGATRESYVKAAEATRHVGTNGLPTLLAMFRSEDSPLKQRLMVLVPGRWLRSMHFTPASLQHRRALFALDALGRSATPAAPELIRLLNVTNAEIRRFTAQALGSLGAKEDIIVPALTNALGDKDVEVRLAIEENLGRIGKEPQVAIPALMAGLSSTSAAEIKEICLALSKFGPQARAAVPPLLEFSQHKTPAIRIAASDALKHITREATKKP